MLTRAVMSASSDAGKLNVFWQDGDVVLLRRSREERSAPLLAQRPVSPHPSARIVARLEHTWGCVRTWTRAGRRCRPR